jgi:prevent-host-death family protein
MTMPINTWKLRDAKARFSELVRQARSGHPQRVTVHGKEAMLVVDPERFEIRRKEAAPMTMAEFIERSKPYRAKSRSEELKPPPRIEMDMRPSPFEDFESEGS